MLPVCKTVCCCQDLRKISFPKGDNNFQHYKGSKSIISKLTHGPESYKYNANSRNLPRAYGQPTSHVETVAELRAFSLWCGWQHCSLRASGFGWWFLFRSFLQSQCGGLKQSDFLEAVYLLQISCRYSRKSRRFTGLPLAKGAYFNVSRSLPLSELMSGPGCRAGPFCRALISHTFLSPFLLRTGTQSLCSPLRCV